jgi:hypothetical protein
MEYALACCLKTMQEDCPNKMPRRNLLSYFPTNKEKEKNPISADDL